MVDKKSDFFSSKSWLAPEAKVGLTYANSLVTSGAHDLRCHLNCSPAVQEVEAQNGNSERFETSRDGGGSSECW